MKTGFRIPSTPVQQLVDGEIRQVDLASFSAGKTIVLVAVPGAFTPTCSDDHVPGYIEGVKAFRDAGKDERSEKYARQWIAYVTSEEERQLELEKDLF